MVFTPHPKSPPIPPSVSSEGDPSPQWFPFVLAGGGGSRLWPLSRDKEPKQFQVVPGCERPMLIETLHRFEGQGSVPRKSGCILTSHGLLEGLQQELEAYHYGAWLSQVVVEPARKNTAPALAWGVYGLLARPDFQEADVAVICPSDHLIPDAAPYLHLVEAAVQVAHREQKIVLIGIQPTRPETGYGYIRRQDKTIGMEGPHPVFGVEGFFEKPSLAVAESYLQAKTYFWNAGMVVAPLGVLKAELMALAPEVVAWWTEPCLERREAMFCDGPSVSFDVAVLEQSNRLLVMPFTGAWSDLGSWDSLYDLLAQVPEGQMANPENNVTLGNTVMVGTQRSLVVSHTAKTIACLGVDDLIVIDTADALLVARRGESQRVRELQQVAETSGQEESEIFDAHIHRTRPWGSYHRFQESTGAATVRFQLNPGERLILEVEASTRFLVVRGTVEVTEALGPSHVTTTPYGPLGTWQSEPEENPSQRMPLTVTVGDEGAEVLAVGAVSWYYQSSSPGASLPRDPSVSLEYQREMVSI